MAGTFGAGEEQVRGQGLIWSDGTIVPFESATVHVLSHGVQRGTSVFDVMRVVDVDDGPMVFGLRPHVARFLRSMELMAMERPYSAGEIEAAIATTVLANPGAGVVKLVASWSEVAPRSMPVSLRPSVFVAALPSSVPAVSGEHRLAPVRLMTASAPKPSADLLPPSLKVAASYTVGVRERLLAMAQGFDDVLFKTESGDLAEGTTQSAFVVRGGRLLVPPLDTVLDGITRRAVLEMAHEMGLNVEVRPVHWDEVMSADELFLCSTNTPVLPVSVLDDRQFAADGPISAQLDRAVSRLLAGTHPLSSRWLTALSPLVDAAPTASR